MSPLARIGRLPLALCVLCCLLASCAVPGAIVYKVFGPDAIKPEYTPPPTEPILIFAEDFENPSIATYESEEITHVVAQVFKERNVAPVIDPEKLSNLLNPRPTAGQTPPKPTSITELGRQLGAARVLYIDIVDNAMESLGGTQMLRGTLTLRVRMIDVATGKTLYPANSIAGTYLSARTPYTEVHAGVTPQSLRQKLCTELGQRIARLFYPYKPDEVDTSDVQP